ncbi:hypothetical protein C2S51_037823 [Perilla frutescens var. frutescens]|nr:hypothetical protein C2S51_037823 [Perilla frutescens var. frutescens]
MASLQSSCTVVATKPNHRISPFPKTFSANPSLLLTRARRSHRSQVSCNGDADKKPSEEARVDRRNMLLGLGGLYGAANLISDPRANANPIQAPEFKICGTAHDFNTGDPLDVNCCPPLAGNIIDYKLPPVTKLRRRSAVHKLSKDNIAKYEEAIRRMRELDKTDPTDPRGFTQQANIHCAYCNGAHDQVGYSGLDLSVHYSWIFFPFHRWYLYFYERILGSLINDPTFALPFWNWDNPKGMHLPPIFDNEKSTLYDANRNQDHRGSAIVNLALNSDVTDPLQIISNNLSIMYNEMIGGVNSAIDFMGQPYKAGDPVPPMAQGGTSERGSHISIHAWVGDPRNKYNEDLGNFYSAGRDTAFYCHHSNVDRMWAIWKSLKADYPKDINDPDYLNASFLFYDENKQLVKVKVADCLDYRKMGYEYEKIDVPWLSYRPTKRDVRAKIQDISKGAERAEKVFPITLDNVVRVLVSKPSKGQANEVLVVQDILTDSTKLVKFDVYVNDEDNKPQEVDKAEYAGTFAQLPQKIYSKTSKGSLRLSLKELYENIDIGDDDSVVVTIIPRYNGKYVTIGGVKIIPAASA